MIADSDRFFTYAIQQENKSMHKTIVCHLQVRLSKAIMKSRATLQNKTSKEDGKNREMYASQ